MILNSKPQALNPTPGTLNSLPRLNCPSVSAETLPHANLASQNGLQSACNEKGPLMEKRTLPHPFRGQGLQLIEDFDLASSAGSPSPREATMSYTDLLYGAYRGSVCVCMYVCMYICMYVTCVKILLEHCSSFASGFTWGLHT